MKITLRELFLVTVIAALAMGWWYEQRSNRRRLEQLQGERDELAGHIEMAKDLCESKGLSLGFNGTRGWIQSLKE